MFETRRVSRAFDSSWAMTWRPLVISETSMGKNKYTFTSKEENLCFILWCWQEVVAGWDIRVVGLFPPTWQYKGILNRDSRLGNRGVHYDSGPLLGNRIILGSREVICLI
jgi:hypothetical protein